MSKVAVLVLCFFSALPCVSIAQTFSLQELMMLTTKNLDEFDTFVVKRGFKFQEATKDKGLEAEGFSYALNQSETSLNAEKFITLYTKYFYDGDKNVTFQTSLVTDYLKIKAK